MPSVLVLTYSPVHAGSVAAWGGPRNSAGVSRTRHSSSVVGRVVSSVAMHQRYVDGGPAHRQCGYQLLTVVGPFMSDASVGAPACFRPTWQQALARGLYLGVLVAVAGVCGAVFAVMVASALLDPDVPPHWLWLLLAVGPPVIGAG